MLGARNSGAEHTGIYILEALGIDYQRKFTLGYMTYGASASAMQDGNIVGMNVPAGPPVTAITQAFAQMRNNMTVLDFDSSQIAAINQLIRFGRRMNYRPRPTHIKMSRS